jgi:hypothetical protein
VNGTKTWKNFLGLAKLLLWARTKPRIATYRALLIIKITMNRSSTQYQQISAQSGTLRHFFPFPWCMSAFVLTEIKTMTLFHPHDVAVIPGHSFSFVSCSEQHLALFIIFLSYPFFPFMLPHRDQNGRERIPKLETYFREDFFMK